MFPVCFPASVPIPDLALPLFVLALPFFVLALTPHPCDGARLSRLLDVHGEGGAPLGFCWLFQISLPADCHTPPSLRDTSPVSGEDPVPQALPLNQGISLPGSPPETGVASMVGRGVPPSRASQTLPLRQGEWPSGRGGMRMPHPVTSDAPRHSIRFSCQRSRPRLKPPCGFEGVWDVRRTRFP